MNQINLRKREIVIQLGGREFQTVWNLGAAAEFQRTTSLEGEALMDAVFGSRLDVLCEGLAAGLRQVQKTRKASGEMVARVLRHEELEDAWDAFRRGLLISLGRDPAEASAAYDALLEEVRAADGGLGDEQQEERIPGEAEAAAGASTSTSSGAPPSEPVSTLTDSGS